MSARRRSEPGTVAAKPPRKSKGTPCRAPDMMDLIGRVFDSAKAHGEQSDPDHEAGDLRTFVEMLSASIDVNTLGRVVKRYFDEHDEWT